MSEPIDLNKFEETRHIDPPTCAEELALVRQETECGHPFGCLRLVYDNHGEPEEYCEWCSDLEAARQKHGYAMGRLKRTARVMVKQATLAERERCAKIAESYDDGGENHQCNNACTDIAQAIRAGETI